MECNAQIQLNGFIWQKHVFNKSELIFSNEIYWIVENIIHMVSRPKLYFKYLKFFLLKSIMYWEAWTIWIFETIPLKVAFLMKAILKWLDTQNSLSDFCPVSFMSWQFSYWITSNFKTSEGRRGKLSLTNKWFIVQGLLKACSGLSAWNRISFVSLFY